MRQLLTELSDALADVSEGTLRSLVQVRCGEHGAGAGAVWQPDGLIVTNAHVVSRRGLRGRGTRRRLADDAITVLLADGQVLPAHLLATDEDQDLAALRVDAHALPSVVPGDSRRLQPGALVVALGLIWRHKRPFIITYVARKLFPFHPFSILSLSSA